jgi:hypothetical protein
MTHVDNNADADQCEFGKRTLEGYSQGGQEFDRRGRIDWKGFG